MRKALKSLSVALFTGLFCSTVSLASGFRLPDQDAAAMGMAGAFTGQADNPSAVWYNPAGITRLEGTRMSAGLVGIFPILKHENTDGTTDVSKRDLFLPPQLFATRQVNDSLFFGIGVNSPFGLSTNWPDTSAASSIATFSRVRTTNINPNLAYRVTDGLSIALGIDYTKLEATLERMLSPGVNFRLDGEGSGWGANAAILSEIGDQVNLGLSYRSRVKITVDKATAEIPGISNPVATEITLPDLAQAGVSFSASEKLTLNADLEYTWWSTYDRLVLKSNTILALTGDATDTSIEEKDWKNTWTVRIGGRYELSEKWKLRAGYVYDQNPVPSERFEITLPDSDRQGITIGAGYSKGNITIDTSYLYLVFSKRTITGSIAGKPAGSPPVASLNGTYKSQAHLAAVTVGYKF